MYYDFQKNRKRKDVLFIDASSEDNYDKAINQYIIREEDIQKIISTYEGFQVIDKYSYVASSDEIVENDYNLNIPRYVDTYEEEKEIDIRQTRLNIDQIKKNLLMLKLRWKSI